MAQYRIHDHDRSGEIRGGPRSVSGLFLIVDRHAVCWALEFGFRSKTMLWWYRWKKIASYRAIAEATFNILAEPGPVNSIHFHLPYSMQAV